MVHSMLREDSEDRGLSVPFGRCARGTVVRDHSGSSFTIRSLMAAINSVQSFNFATFVRRAIMAASLAEPKLDSIARRNASGVDGAVISTSVSYTHLRAH